MKKTVYDSYVSILSSELIPALGCTEPIAIAYAGALARRTLEDMPLRVEAACSGNIIKNVKAVSVPNSGGGKGVEVAALIGVFGGNAAKKLAVLEDITDEHRALVAEGLRRKMCVVSLLEGDENLHIILKVFSQEHDALVEIKDSHLHVSRIERDGQPVFIQDDIACPKLDKSTLNLHDIVAFADELRVEDVRQVLDRQIAYNSAISQEGIAHPYGAQIGRILMSGGSPNDIYLRMKAAAAAGSDARMNGCTLPVVINSGSGNQGITVSIPVIEYAKRMNATENRLYRALALSNLVALLQKHNIGSLSAFCGAVCAATGAACGVAYLDEQPFDVIAMTITNALGMVSGIVCDGAKSSCAGKIAESLDAAFLGYSMAKNHIAFQPGEGLVKDDVESTIQSVGRMGKIGMASTDTEILKIMLDQ